MSANTLLSESGCMLGIAAILQLLLADMCHHTLRHLDPWDLLGLLKVSECCEATDLGLSCGPAKSVSEMVMQKEGASELACALLGGLLPRP